MKRFAYFREGALAGILCLAGVLTAHAANVDQYIQEAKKYQQKGEHRSAIIQLKNALQKDANQPQVRLMLAQSYLRMGDGASAEKEIRRASELGADKVQVLPVLGQSLMLQRKFKDVLAEIKPGQDADGKDQAALLALQGNAYLGLAQLDEAQAKFDAALKLDADSEEAWLGQARAMMLRGDKNVQKQVDVLVERFPRSTDAWLLKGDLHRLHAEYPQGTDAFKKALDLEPENLNALLGEAMMLVAQKKYQESDKHIQTVLRLVPRHPMANYLKGLADFQQGNLAPAREVLQQTLAVAPKFAPAHLLLGAVSYSKGDLEQAAESLKFFLSVVPNHLPARKLYAATQLKLKQPDRAIEAIKAVLKDHDDDPQLLALLGSAYMQKGDANNGVEYLEKAVAAAPDAAVLRTQLALGYMAAGEGDNAVSELESAVDLGGVTQADTLLVLSHLQRGEFDKALKSAQGLAKKVPNNPVPANMMGAAYIGKNDITNARKQFEQALKYDPNFASARFNLAKLDEKAGDFAAAKRQYQLVLDRNDKDVKAMVELARLADRSGNQGEAVNLLQQARTKVPDAMEPGILLARYQMTHGDALKALSVVQDLTSRFPDHPLVLEIAGEVQLANKQSSNALASFRKLTEKLPKSPRAYYLLASAQMVDNDHKGAEASVNKALELLPDFPEAMVLLAASKDEQGQTQEALGVAQRLQKMHPDAALGYELEGGLYLKSKKLAEAEKAYQSAYQHGANAALAVKLYQVRRALGQSNAIDALSAWTKGHPDDVPMALTLATAYQAEQRNKEAIAEYERVVQKSPQNPVALNNLAWVYHEVGDGRAVEYAERAYKLKPEEPAIVDTLGWLLIQGGNSNRGLTLLQEAAMRAPHIPEIRYHMAVGLEKAGRRDDARKELQRLLRDNKDFPLAADARAMLDRLGKN